MSTAGAGIVSTIGSGTDVASRDLAPERADLLQMAGITKSFGSLIACNNVDFSVRRSEIHGLLGENGAGKSTLMKVLVGLVPFEAGEVRLEGERIHCRDPRSASRSGIAMVQQHFSLVEQLRVWENVALALEGRLSRGQAIARTQMVGERYGLAVNPEARVDRLSVGQRQRVELIKCLCRDPKLLILDEPTAVLTIEESRAMFALMRQVVASGEMSVVLISHKLAEILESTDRVTVMRDGRVVDRRQTSEATMPGLARMMIGRPVVLQSERAALGLQAADTAAPAEAARSTATEHRSDGSTEHSSDGSTEHRSDGSTEHRSDGSTENSTENTDGSTNAAMRLEGIAVETGPDQTPLRQFSLTVHPGEIVGIAGVDGNGQSAFVDLMMGSLKPVQGTIEVNGVPVKAARRGAMKNARVGVIPEDRHAAGCILDMTVAENFVLTELDEYRYLHLFINDRRLNAEAARRAEEFSVACSSVKTPMRSLSGGNQQRVVVGRELSCDPVVLIACQPYRGLDVAGVEFVTEKLRAASNAGIAIVLISNDLEEILGIADRITVIHDGRLVGELNRGSFDVERLGLMMGGHVA